MGTRELYKIAALLFLGVCQNPTIRSSKEVVIERMGYLDCYYNRGGGRRSWQSSGGFRLSLRRFTVRWLQVRLFKLIGFLCWWKFRGEQASQLLKKGIGNSCSNNCCRSSTKSIKRRTAILEVGGSGYSSNSYYSELAIRECLEYIKMSSSALSSDEEVIHP